MTATRSLPPLLGSATPVRFPAIAREELASGLRVWSMPWRSVPVVTVALLLESGAAEDPEGLPGLAAFAADLTDEGAGGRGVVELTEAFARLGTHLDVDAGHDATLLTFTTLAKNLHDGLALLADVVIRPHLAEQDFERIRDLRVARLRQMSSAAGSAADRAFLGGVFGAHPYGHGTLGTTRAAHMATLDAVRDFHQRMFRANRATLIVAGDVPAGDVVASAAAHFGAWSGHAPARAPFVPDPLPAAPRCLLVNRAGAPQSELRIGHLGPPRDPHVYPALATLNAALGGQFTSRLNQLLRETKGYTYGVRTSFDFRRRCSAFACDTSVQSDATADAVRDVLDEFRGVVSTRPIADAERVRAQDSLTRGYVRHFETAAHLVRAAIELVKLELPDDTFDRFVPAVAAVTSTNVHDAACRFIRENECVIVIVGDAERHRADLSAFGRDVVEMTPEF
jgi:zinc protease